jgi:hypothetical protein
MSLVTTLLETPNTQVILVEAVGLLLRDNPITLERQNA